MNEELLQRIAEALEVGLAKLLFPAFLDPVNQPIVLLLNL